MAPNPLCIFLAMWTYTYNCDLPQDHCKQPPNNRSIPKVDPRPFKPSALVSSHPILCFPYIVCIQCDILVGFPLDGHTLSKSVCLQELGREQFDWHHTQLQLDTSNFVRAQAFTLTDAHTTQIEHPSQG